MGSLLHIAILVVQTFLASGVLASSATSTLKEGSVYCVKKRCSFSDHLDWKIATATGTFDDSLFKSGWGILDISAGYSKVDAVPTNEEIMYGAGFLEGVFTARHMESHYTNLRNALLPKSKVKVIKKLRNWFVKQREWSDMMIAAFGKKDPFWRHISYILAQQDGLFAGYKSVSNNTDEALDEFAISFLNANGDFLDISKFIDKSTIPDWTKFSAEEAERYFTTNGHCSALIKVLPGFENIYMSHSTWFVYQATDRIFKHYSLNVRDPFIAARNLSFSSYPGYLASLDDFYLLSSGMVIIQTTINVFNNTLYEKVSEESLLAWQRVRVANMMGNTGEEWTNIFKRYNSGTYNNEYMVIDLKKFQPSLPLPDGLLWVADQIPGLVVAADATDILRAGYFPSYNVPFFEEIYNKSGNAAYAKKHGLKYTYDLAPRAKIFRRDAGKVSDLAGMKSLMRYNDYKNDSYSGGSPWGAICSRGDLDKNKPIPNGCSDTKVSDFFMAKKLQADIINGPTLGTNLPPFSWIPPFTNVSHLGLPSTYNFKFIRTQPRF